MTKMPNTMHAPISWLTGRCELLRENTDITSPGDIVHDVVTVVWWAVTSGVVGVFAVNTHVSSLPSFGV